MKNFLAIDTSGDYMCVVAAKDGKIYSTFTPDCAMKHSVMLLPNIEETLNKANMHLDECDFFAAVVGAGSFTGIRIGISAIKGFALAFDKPTLPITSFALSAYNSVDEQKGKTLHLVDALHDCYYACGYENGEVVYPPAFLTESQVLQLQKDGYTLYSCSPLATLSQKSPVTVVNPVTGLENAVLRLADSGAFGELAALYVRKSSAEENLKQ